jgi:uncharacterized membrane protein (DUF373 family)
MRRQLLSLLDDHGLLRFVDRGERAIVKALALLLLLVTIVAAVQLCIGVLGDLFRGRGDWLGERLIRLLGDLLNLLIALEVMQNITSYLRRGVVQIELVLLTAITAVARKVIVMPSVGEEKAQLLISLGLAVLALALAYWLVRQPSAVLGARTTPARLSPGQDPSPADDGDDGLRSEVHRRD